ncbi:serine/threonine protein kinase [Streptomyces sp. NRRL F-5635]|uniref:serine/threonine protein kinase n=1 Tax=Streptomyces sp. NRRL F-5635 TaxID=1463865 RepID=UPI0004CDC11C|nr:protein kinase [Streptomyces sp. NRRL F-5635]
MTEPYAVPVPRGYRVGGWEVREPIATGAFGSVYAARRVLPGPGAPDDTGRTAADAEHDGGRPDGTRRTNTGTGTRTDTGTGTGTGTGLTAADAPDPADRALRPAEDTPGGVAPGAGPPDAVALKFLPTGTGTPRQLSHLRDLVEREVELLRRLRRPRLIRMYETLTVDDPGRPRLDGATVLVLERAEGSLSALLSATPRPRSGPALLAQICEGLHQLHHAGWVHGDLKPANVLLMKDGSVRLADFNMAAELEGTHAYTPAFSTPDYTPPELLWSEIGERGRRIRPSADVWAFGVLAHLVLTGSFPLPGGTPTARRDAAVAYSRGSHELRLSPELPSPWREIVRACLTRTHADRIGTDALLRRVADATGSAGGPARPSFRTRARPRLVAAAVTGLLALAALGHGVARWAGEGRDPVARPGGTASAVAAASYGAAELRTDRDVPPAYRLLIVETAHDCGHAEVSPALIAAMLKVESDFDPDLADPARDEYGIARWTPSVLRWWMNADGTPGETVPQPPFPPAESVPAMGRYLCWITPRLDAGLRGDRRVLVAVAYRTSYKKVNDAGGVPPKYRDYADRVAHRLQEYTPRGGT